MLIIKLKSCTSFPDVAVVSALLQRCRLNDNAQLSWKWALLIRRAHSPHVERFVQFHYNDRKSNSEHIPYGERVGSPVYFSLALSVVSLTDRCLTIALCNVNNEDQIHFKAL